MKRVKDYLRQGSASQIRGNLANIANRLERSAAELPIGALDDYVGLAATRLMRAIARELRAAAPQFKKDISAFVWRTRNIFECMLLLKHATSSEELAKQFVAQKIGDEKSILDGLLSIAEPTLPGLDLIRERSEKCSHVLAKHGFDKASPWRMDQVARTVGMESEYTGFYKMFSKYVHPSAWTVIADADEFESDQYWEVFLIQAQLHSLHATKVGENIVAARTGGASGA